jgi:hypothetical protein
VDRDLLALWGEPLEVELFVVEWEVSLFLGAAGAVESSGDSEALYLGNRFNAMLFIVPSASPIFGDRTICCARVVVDILAVLGELLEGEF